MCVYYFRLLYMTIQFIKSLFINQVFNGPPDLPALVCYYIFPTGMARAFIYLNTSIIF